MLVLVIVDIRSDEVGSDTELAGTQLLQLSTPSDALQPRHSGARGIRQGL